MKRARWTRKIVQRVRSEIKAELDAIAAEGDEAAALRHAVARIHALKDDVTSFGILRGYTYICAALIQHARSGGLRDPDVNRFSDLAERLLMLQGIDPFESPLSYLYAELQSIVGQIRRGEALHWDAAWHAQLALGHAHGDAAGSHAGLFVTAGNRALRLGHAPLAAEAFATALQGELGRSHREAAALGYVKALRLAGDRAGAAAAARATDRAALSEDGATELAWELACLAAHEAGDLEALRAALAGIPQDKAFSYRLEAHLWARARGRRQDAALLVKVPGLRRRFPASARVYASFVAAVSRIEELHDTELPIHRRLSALVDLDRLGAAQVSVDKELLLLASAARWLDRLGRKPMARLIGARYTTLSMTLTDGATRDALGVVSDVLDRSQRQAPRS